MPKWNNLLSCIVIFILFQFTIKIKNITHTHKMLSFYESCFPSRGILSCPLVHHNFIPILITVYVCVCVKIGLFINKCI